MSDKTIRLLIDLTYNQDIMHGDDEESIEWFNEILLGDNLHLGDFGDLGDMIGSVKVVPHAADRIEELQAKLAGATEALENADRVIMEAMNNLDFKTIASVFNRMSDIRTTIAELKGEPDGE